MTNLTSRQLLVASYVREHRVRAVFHRGWGFVTDHGETVTAAVRQLVKKGLVDVMYFTGNRAAVNLTDTGRALYS